MFPPLPRLVLLSALLAGAMCAQEVRVRPAPRVEMPTQVDSNSPAFWRNDRLFWYGSHGRPWLSEGPGQAGPWETREVSLETTNHGPHWLESVWPEDDRVVWGWYHFEPVGLFADSTLTAPKIGAVVSFDGGNTLRDLGVVLESGDRLEPTAQNGYFAGGHGDFSVILDRERKYFYFFFDNYGGTAESQGVCLARMAYEDRANPVGKVWKYYNGQWQEAGRGGRVTPVFPVNRDWQTRDPDAFWGPSVHWNTHLNCHVMLLNRAQGEPGWSQEGVYVSFSYDLSRPDAWTLPQKILGKSQFPGWYFFYPQVMGRETGGTDREAGETARLYVGGVSKWEIDFIAPLAAPAAVRLRTAAASTVVPGGAASALTVSASGTKPFTYEWLKDGEVLPQATTATYTIAAATANDAGVYVVVVTNDLGMAESNRVTLEVTVPSPPAPPAPEPPPPPTTTPPPPAPPPTPAPPPPPEAFLTNLAVRSLLPSEQAMLTVGFVLQSAEPKPILVRAIGPTLGLFGVVEAAVDPRLAIFDAAARWTGENDNWQSGQGENFAGVGAFALPAGSADAALQVVVPSGPGTAQVRVTAAGVVLAEIYDPAASAHSKLVNLSALGLVGAGEQVMIGGFRVSGSGTKRLLIRALGPQLEAFGVSAALADPALEVYEEGQVLIAANDDWDFALAPTFAATGASLLVPGSRDAAVDLTLEAGHSYTVVVRGRRGLTGEALLEIYEVP